MAKIEKDLIQRLRDITGVGLMDCRKALEETEGDLEKAVDLLRKKGALVAAKRSDKTTTEGLIQAYIHPGAQIGVLLELNCETDFVARIPDIQQLANDLCMHIAAAKPLYLSPSDVDPTFLAREREVVQQQLAGSGKAEKVVDQIVEGKMNKVYTDICLLKQPFVKNDQFTVEQLLEHLMAKTGESIRIKRFARFEIGA
jgi:elongation factor Ts